MRIIDCDQRSPEWIAARVGRLGASTAHEVFSKPRRDGTEAAGRRNLRIRLALERIVGRSLEYGYVSPAMQQGIDREADALGMYEVLTGRVLSQVGFVAHDTLMTGCSPDGHVWNFEGLVEAKCPYPAAHLDALKTGQIPSDYQIQVQHQLWITGASWCDWLSYCPEFPEPLQVKLIRVDRDAAKLASYELMVSLFLSEVDAEVELIRGLTPTVAV